LFSENPAVPTNNTLTDPLDFTLTLLVSPLKTRLYIYSLRMYIEKENAASIWNKQPTRMLTPFKGTIPKRLVKKLNIMI